MVGVGETHPAKPVVVVFKRVEPVNGAICYPVSVVPLALDGVFFNLGGVGVTAARRVDIE